MKIHHGLPHFAPGVRRIVTTGTFDGVHLGHQALLQWMVDEARIADAETVVLTFDPHPRKVLFGENCGLELLQSMDQRAAALADTGLDHLVIQPFDRAFSRLRPTEFVRDVLVQGLGCTTVVVGHDHRFGAGREGNEDLLRECGETYGFDVTHIPPHIEDELTVSSTKVRQRVQAGEVEGAQSLLGRPFAWQGQVVRGDGRGRQLGFPTANLTALEADQILPEAGVYAVEVDWADNPSDHPQAGMAHLGARPTFEAADAPAKVEVHLLDAGRPDLYGRTLSLSFATRLRGVEKFDSPDDLVTQLHRDAQAAKAVLQQRNGNDGR